MRPQTPARANHDDNAAMKSYLGSEGNFLYNPSTGEPWSHKQDGEGLECIKLLTIPLRLPTIPKDNIQDLARISVVPPCLLRISTMGFPETPAIRALAAFKLDWEKAVLINFLRYLCSFGFLMAKTRRAQ